MVDHKLYGSRAEFDATIDGVLEEFGVELVCLAGFMRILTRTFVKKWNGTRLLFFNAISNKSCFFFTKKCTRRLCLIPQGGS